MIVYSNKQLIDLLTSLKCLINTLHDIFHFSVGCILLYIHIYIRNVDVDVLLLMCCGK